jgi:excisionase family DNA binding protein
LIGNFSLFSTKRAGVSIHLRNEMASTKLTEPTISDPNTLIERLAVSTAEAARLAGVGRTTIYEAIGSGALRSLKIGKRRLILIVSIREWLETAQGAFDSAARRPASPIPDVDPSEQRVYARASCIRRSCAVDSQSHRSPCGDGG